MSEILELAMSLGRAIAQSREFVALRDWETKARGDREIHDLTTAYEAQLRRIAECEQRQEPIEPAEKRKLIELRERVHAAPTLQELVRVQADYTELMNRINSAINAELKIEATEA